MVKIKDKVKCKHFYVQHLFLYYRKLHNTHWRKYMKIGIDIGGSHIAIAKVQENKILDKKNIIMMKVLKKKYEKHSKIYKTRSIRNTKKRKRLKR